MRRFEIKTMGISEERLHVLVPLDLKSSLKEAARKKGVSVGEYVRRLIDVDLRRGGKRRVSFPFGENPIRTGRRRGSVDHDRIS
jgi:hypothetical protein